MARVPFQFSFIFFLVCSLCFLEVSNAVGGGPVPPSVRPPPARPPAALDCAAACLKRCLLPSPKPRRQCLLICQECCLLYRCVPVPSAPKECPGYKDGKDKDGNKCP